MMGAGDFRFQTVPIEVLMPSALQPDITVLHRSPAPTMSPLFQCGQLLLPKIVS